MKKEIIQQLYSAFEQAALEIDGVECWSARELQKLLGYSLWQNFTKVIDKAKVACETVNQSIYDHFIGVRKMVSLGSGSEREIEDLIHNVPDPVCNGEWIIWRYCERSEFTISYQA